MTQNDDVEEVLESIASASLLAIVSRSLESALGAVSLPQFRLLVILARSRWTPIAHLAPLTGA
jgi:hypothetical protein